MSSRARPTSPAPPPAAEPALLDRVLFYAVLAILCARPMIAETYEPGQMSFLAALQPGAGPTPATTAWLDASLLAASVLTLARRDRWRRSGLVALGIGLLAAAVVISSAAAGDKPLALLAGCSLFVSVLTAAALVSLVQARWMRHMLLAATLATGCATAIKCVNQAISENPQTLQEWKTVYKPQLIRQGYDPDDPLIVNFERRMLSAEAYGFLSHPNITGSCLMMWLLAAIGALAAGIANARSSSDRPMLPLAAGALVCALLTVALALTRSRGALVAGTLGVVTVAMLGGLARWIADHARGVLTVLVAVYVMVIAGTAGYGVAKGTLPHSSLAFRWYYWTAAARAIQDAPLTGVGRDNFAAAYVRYKAPESPEEVRDPHNVWVSLLTELGPLGLAGGVVLCAAALFRGLRSLAPPTTVSPPLPDWPTSTRVWPLALVSLLLHAGCSGLVFGGMGGVLIWIQDILLAWTLPLVATVWLLGKVGTDPRHATWLTAGCCAALLAAFVHGLLDFALLTPGGLAVFVLCVAAAARGRMNAPEDPAPARRRKWARPIPIGVGVALVAAQLAAVVWPTTRAAVALRHLDAALRTPPPAGPELVWRAAAGYTAAHGGDEAARIAIRALLHVAHSQAIPEDERPKWLALAELRAKMTCQVNPRETSNFVLLATIDEDLAVSCRNAGKADEALAYRRTAAENWQRAVELYPTNPRTRIAAGRAWFDLWQLTGEPAAALHAREDLEAALWIDDRRPPEEVVRLRSSERDPAIEFLRQLSVTSAPAPTSPK